MITTYLSSYERCESCVEIGKTPMSYMHIDIVQIGNALNFHQYTYDLEMTIRELEGQPDMQTEQTGFLDILIGAESAFHDGLLKYPNYTLQACERIDGDIIPAWLLTVHLAKRCITCGHEKNVVTEFLVYPFSMLRIAGRLVEYSTLIKR